jgi:hypothetical protein
LVEHQLPKLRVASSNLVSRSSMLKAIVSVSLILVVNTAIAQKLPVANQKVIEYVNSVMGTQVGTGECSDLLMGAQFYIRGIKPGTFKKKQTVLPGDFIAFDDVQIGGLSFPQHYAIIVKVESPTVYIIAHQNHGGYKKVHEKTIDLSKKTSGKITISRPK